MVALSITKPPLLCKSAAALALFFGLFTTCLQAEWQPDPHAKVPEPVREFRGVWVATVYNIDWPSSPGLSASQQKQELINILNRVASLNMNAVVLQVRPMSDALYQSRIEPWSYYLTGRMGSSPSYDPLEFAVLEAHRRGLELHAWFNPFRAKTGSDMAVASNHITRTHPEVIRKAGSHLWADPSSSFVRERAYTVMIDVVNRYDVDGIHIDDYFYPYPDSGGGENFDDYSNWTQYKKSGGRMSRDDWRRDHINTFVNQTYIGIKRNKPWVKFGISPFGIYRPGHPSSIDAKLDSYAHLYADSRRWLQQGWLDYCSPQLYWKIGDHEHSFATLYSWWESENRKHRHVWPGIAASRIRGGSESDGRYASEIVDQIGVTRKVRGRSPAVGHIFWSYAALRKDLSGVNGLLTKTAYQEPALPPPSPWLSGRAGRMPVAAIQRVDVKGNATTISWHHDKGDIGPVRWWAVQVRHGNQWRLVKVLPAPITTLTMGGRMDGFAITPVDYVGKIGSATAFRNN